MNSRVKTKVEIGQGRCCGELASEPTPMSSKWKSLPTRGSGTSGAHSVVKKTFWILLSLSLFFVATAKAIDVDFFDLEEDALNDFDGNGEKPQVEPTNEDEHNGRNRVARSIFEVPTFVTDEISCSEGQIKREVLGQWRCMPTQDSGSSYNSDHNHNNGNSTNKASSNNNNAPTRRASARKQSGKSG